jgi:hypothetical protein
MSMDDIHIAAQNLAAGLEKYNEGLRASFKEVDDAHNRVKPLWDDEMGRDYESSWRPLVETMERYNQVVGPQYIDDIMNRLNHLRNYLHGQA